MKILYVTQFYWPENIAGAFRATEHARVWSELGNDVFVYTAYPNYPIGKVFEGYSNDLFSVERDSLVKVLRNKITIKPNTSLTNRVINGGSYMFSGLRNYSKLKKTAGSDFDVVLASSGPVFTGFLGMALSKKLKVPLVTEFRDLAFEQMVATGTDRNSWKVKLLRWFEITFCKASSRVVVLTNGFKALLADNGIDSDKISVIPNGANVKICKRCSAGYPLAFGYFGTMGISQDVCRTIDILSEACLGIESKYILIGEGAVRSSVERKNEHDKNHFVELFHGMPMSELEGYYSQIDFSIVSLQNNKSFAATVPSKIFQSFARGVPVVFIGPEGEAAKLVRNSGAGIALTGTDKENSEDMKTFLSSADRDIRIQQMRNKAKVVMEERYSRTKLAEEMACELARVVRMTQ